MARKVFVEELKPSWAGWLLRLAQSLMLTAVISFVLSTFVVAALSLVLIGLFLLPGLSNFAAGVTDTILQVLAIFGGGDWRRGILVIALPMSAVSVLFDGFVFFQNHGSEAWDSWGRSK